MAIQKFSGYSREQRDQANKEAEKRPSSGLYKLTKDARHVLRFCPAKPPNQAMTTVWEHFFQVGSNWVSFACPRQTNNDPCPECEYEETLKSSGNEADDKAAFKRSASLVHYANVIPGGAAADPQVVRMVSLSNNLRAKIDKQCEEYAKENGLEYFDFFDIENGCDIVINVPKTGMRDVTVTLRRGGVAAPLDPDGDWVHQLKSFKRRTKLYPPGVILQLMDGVRLSDVTGRTTGTNKRLTSGKRSVADDVDDDKDDEDDED